MFFTLNTLLLAGLVLANGGRHDWAYLWGAGFLFLNTLPLAYQLWKSRCRRHGRGPVFWLVGVLLPWVLFIVAFAASPGNPSHELLYPNNLFSPLIPLEHNEGLPATPNPERSVYFLAFIAGLLVMIANLLFSCYPRARIRAHLTVLFLFGALLAVVGALMKLSGETRFLWILEFREPAAFATFFYKNHWAYFALLCSGIGMGLFHHAYAKEKTSGHFPEKSAGIALLVLVLLISIPLAEARAASLVAVPLAMAFIVSLIRPLFRSRKLLAPGLLLIAVGFSFWGIYTVSRPQMERSIQRSEQQLNAFEKDDFRRIKRIALYRDSWQMIQDKPLWGWGIGSFIHIHPIYAGPEFYHKSTEYPVAYEFCHSDPLQSLVEFGFAGCALLFAPFVTLLLGLKRSCAQNRLSPWLLAACAGVLVASTVDMVFTAPAIALGVLLCAAAGAGYGIETKQRREGIREKAAARG